MKTRSTFNHYLVMTITTSDSFEFLCFEDEYKPFEIPFFEEDFERYGDFQFDD